MSSGKEDFDNTATPPREKHINPFFQPIALLIAAVIYLLVKPASILYKRAYEGRPFVHALGRIIALGAGILVGYQAGWYWEWSAASWVTSGVVTALAVYFYAWPALHAGVLRRLLRASADLWEAVNTADAPNHWFGSSDSWVSQLIMFASFLTVVGSVIYLFCNTMFTVHTAAITNWIAPFNWAIVAWPVAGFAGAIVGFGAGAIAWSLLSFLRLWLVAVVTGIAYAYAMHPLTDNLVASMTTGWPHAAADIVSGAAALANGVLYIAYLFPLAYLLLTYGCNWVKRILDNLFQRVYDEHETPYQTFYGHVTNLWTTYHLPTLAMLGMLMAGFHLHLHWGVIVGLNCLVGFAAYLILGKLFTSNGGNATIGVIVSLHAGAKVGFAYFAHGYYFGILGSLAAGALTAVLMFFVGFPLFYLAARLVLTVVVPIYKLGEPIAQVHKRMYSLFDQILSELWNAYDVTYFDDTDHRTVFLHTVNIAVAAGLAYGMMTLSRIAGFGDILAWSAVTVVTVFAYVLVGKWLVDAKDRHETPTGNKIVGRLVSLATGITAGAFAYWSVTYGVWTACGAALLSGLISAALTYGFIFPIAYVLVKAVGYAVREEKWLKHILCGAHGLAWRASANAWTTIKEYYQLIDRKVQPVIQSFADTWEDAKQKVRDAWEKNNRK